MYNSLIKLGQFLSYFYLITYVIQFTEEKLGKAEKTELDPNFEQLVTFCDNTKQNTETILKNMEFILNSNPGNNFYSNLVCLG